MPGPEKKLETKCRIEATRRGCLFWKWVSPGTKGVPDRILIVPPTDYHHIMFVELKAPGKKPTKLQEHRHEQLQHLGCEVFVIDSFAAFCALLPGGS